MERGWEERGEEWRDREAGRQADRQRDTHRDYPLCNPSTGGTEREEIPDGMEGCAPNFSHQRFFGAKNVVCLCACFFFF